MTNKGIMEFLIEHKFMFLCVWMVIRDNFTVHINYVFGKNGTGKSTIVKIISGLLLANKGKLVYNRIVMVKYTNTSIRNNIGLIS